MKTILLISTTLIVLSGCAGPQPFSTIKSTSDISVISNRDANLILQTGAVKSTSSDTMIPVGTIFVPINTGPVPELQFHTDNQNEFMQLLKSELKRLNIFNKVAIGDPSNQQDYQITIFFEKTHLNGRNLQYVLDVVMHIKADNKEFKKRYKADSHKDKSLEKKMLMSAHTSKHKAAEELLEMIIPDIQKFVINNMATASS